ncbi:MAG: hypothetical protein HY785_09845 [Oscillatoriophycideae cyanobacterium NC_groundwater_1537_Pr4_S-0.65um_50_18]|nr:hypothetical protein [Oscillatoriophycideae cyanobacterium NC_groundwater_1537_Pr4_S-0.65um_50_18]
MGSLTKKLEDVTGQGDDKTGVKERLELLLLAAKAKIRSYRDEINEQFMNPAQVDRIQIPGIRAIRFIEQYHVAAKQGFSQQVGDHLTKAIDAFFSIGGKDQNTGAKAAVQSGVKALISSGLDAFIGSTEAGETEERIYVVVPENNAFVRADIAIWKYHMESTKIIDDSDTAVAYVLCKSVIDHTKITIDELIYLVSDALAERPQHFEEREFTTSDTPPKTVKKRITLGADGNPIVLDHKKLDTDPTKFQEWSLTAENPPGGKPPSISEVQDYIDELIKVWKKLKEDRGE